MARPAPAKPKVRAYAMTKERRAQARLVAVVGASALASLLYTFRDKIRGLFMGTAFASTFPDGDPIVAPAYPYLNTWTQEDRLALYQANRDLGLDPLAGAIAGVIQHESGGDPTAPHSATGTPRGGLIQLTTGANLPGFKTAEDVWAVRSMSIPDQFTQVVVPYYARMHLASDTSAVMLMRLNFLPGVAHKPDDYVLGVKPGSTGPGGESSDDHLPNGPSLGAIYTNNAGFDKAGRGFFTWSDADASARASEAKAGGQYVTLSGKVTANA